MLNRLIRVLKKIGDPVLDFLFSKFCLRKKKYNDDVYVFLAINGAGLGHLTRALGIAKALKRKRPGAKIIFLSTSIGVPLVVRQGFTCFHVPPFAMVGNVAARDWNALLFSQLSSLISLYNPSKVIFDGTVPYEGLLKGMRRHPRIKYVWIKRGLYKDNTLDDRLKFHLGRFSSVIIPGEVGEEISPPSGNAVFVPPIVMCEPDEVLPVETAVERLGLQSDKKRILVQLGAGNINDISGQLGQVVSYLSARADVEVCVAHSPISLQQVFLPKVKNVEIYPMSWYFSAFDLVICAAGYNSVCEVVYHNIPAILIPNVSTRSDDQVKRADMAGLFGTLALNEPFGRDEFLDCVGRLIDGQNKNAAERKHGQIVNGADNASHIILNV